MQIHICMCIIFILSYILEFMHFVLCFFKTLQCGFYIFFSFRIIFIIFTFSSKVNLNITVAFKFLFLIVACRTYNRLNLGKNSSNWQFRRVIISTCTVKPSHQKKFNFQIQFWNLTSWKEFICCYFIFILSMKFCGE